MKENNSKAEQANENANDEENDKVIAVNALFTVEEGDTTKYKMHLSINKVNGEMLRHLIAQLMTQIIKNEEVNAFSLTTEIMGKVAEEL